MTPDEWRGARYKLLAEGIGDLYGRPQFGWKSKTARRLAIDGGYLNKILSGERATVGGDIVARAIRSVPIRATYFEQGSLPNARPEDADWRDYVTDDGEARESGWEDARALAGALLAASELQAPARARALATHVLADPVVSAAGAVLEATDDARAAMLGYKLAALIERTSEPVPTVDPKTEEVMPARMIVRPKVTERADGTKQVSLHAWPGARGRFVGLRRATKADPESTIVVRVPGGANYVLAGDVEVPETEYFLRAVRRGDLVRVT